VLVLEGLTNAAAAGYWLQWTSVSNKLYAIDASTNLAKGFSGIASNLPATPPLNTFNDVGASGKTFRAYRVRVE